MNCGRSYFDLHGLLNSSLHMNGIRIVLLLLLASGCADRPLSLPSPRVKHEAQGEMAWFPLGNEVYREQDRFAAQRRHLSFVPEPRWFLAFPKFVDKHEYDAYRHDMSARATASGGTLDFDVSPTSDDRYPIPALLPCPKELQDLPLVDQGVSLDFAIQPEDSPLILRFVLTLKTRERDLVRELEHRWTNVLPFLFAFFGDGEPVQWQRRSFSKTGGAKYLTPLASAGDVKTWNITVKAESITALLGNRGISTLDVVAAFSERQHQPLRHEPCPEAVHGMMHPTTYDRPQLVVRSNPVCLERVGDQWEVHH